MSNITCGNCKASHSTVAEVRACYGQPVAKAATTTVREAAKPVAHPASEKQHSYIASLCKQRGIEYAYDATLTGGREGTASKRIEELKAMPVAKAVTGQRTEEPADGIYYDENSNEIFKVYKMVHGSGRQGVKRLEHTVHPEGHVLAGQPKGEFAYLGLAVKHLPTSAKALSLEEAKKFGRIYSFCVKCGATLTDETSIANGIGPVCGAKGW